MNFQHITITYDKKEILTDAQIKLEEGVLCALIAPNGSGKSSLMRYIFCEADKDPALKDNISLLTQEEKTAWDLPVKDYLLMALTVKRLIKRATPDDLASIKKVALDFGISPLLNRMIKTLSGGEFQLVRIIRIVLEGRQFNLLDEPLGALDFNYSKKVLSILRGLTKKGGSILVAIHDLNVALMHFNNLAFIADKKIIQGEAQEVATQAVITKTFGSGVTLYKSLDLNCLQVK